MSRPDWRIASAERISSAGVLADALDDRRDRRRARSPARPRSSVSSTSFAAGAGGGSFGAPHSGRDGAWVDAPAPGPSTGSSCRRRARRRSVAGSAARSRRSRHGGAKRWQLAADRLALVDEHRGPVSETRVGGRCSAIAEADDAGEVGVVVLAEVGRLAVLRIGAVEERPRADIWSAAAGSGRSPRCGSRELAGVGCEGVALGGADSAGRRCRSPRSSRPPPRSAPRAPGLALGHRLRCAGDGAGRRPGGSWPARRAARAPAARPADGGVALRAR